MERSRLRVVCASLILFALAGCASWRYRIRTVDDLGSVRVAVLSVMPWESVADLLQPSFPLDEKGALAKVLPTTALRQQQVLDALRVAVKGSFGAGGAAAPALADVPGATSAAGDRKAADLPVPENLLSQPIGQDPMLEYLAATALFQEVQLANQSLRWLRTEGDLRGYVVRLQVSTMPKRRGAPYDAYVNLSAFGQKALRCSSGPDCNDRYPLPLPDVPVVVPILVTDNLAATQRAVSEATLRDYALAIQGAFQGGAVGVEGDKSREEIDAAVARDLDSRLTVARLCDNTLRIRIGAIPDSQGKLESVARTHAVSLLVLVPKEAKALRFQLGTEWINVDTGRPLSDKPDRADWEDLERIASFYEMAPGAVDKLVKAWPRVVHNDWASFELVIDPVCTSDNCRNQKGQIWHDLAALNVGYGEDDLIFQLPELQSRPFPEQAAFLLDDGRESTRVEISGASGQRAYELCGQLELDPGAGNKKIRLTATKIETLDGGRRARITFPSISRWGLSAYPATLHVASAPTPDVCETGLASWSSTSSRYQRAVEAPPLAGFVLTRLGGKVVVDKGVGAAELLLKPTKDSPAKSATLEVKNANVSAVKIDGREMPKHGATVTVDVPAAGADRVILLGLANVEAGSKIKISSKDDGGRMHDDLDVDTVAAAAPPH